MPSLGGWEFVILIGILVLLFGAKRLPDMARSIGQSARVFKGEMKGMKGDEAASSEKPADPPAAPAPQALPEAQPRAEAPAQEKTADPARASQPGSGSSSGQ
ncbi:MAG TPA: Sec-independent protein translocase subunit TatA [Pseudonocardia sp.]|jgi:sec-independent protein translocase protein TatA|nr:Sec-independent protein translocase subunit TatA [Pseudonocardia sp.]